jgi:hypothetical protein
MNPMPRFPPQGPLGRLFPRFLGTIKALRRLLSFPPRFVAFAWRYHGNTPASLPPQRRVGRVGPGVGHPVSPPGFFRGVGRFSQVSGGPLFPFAHGLRPRPAGFASDQFEATALAPAIGTTKAPTMRHFRGSIAWLSGSLPTYQGAGRPDTAQGLLPGAGQALMDGLSPAGSLQKVSNSLHACCPPFPGFLAQSK